MIHHTSCPVCGDARISRQLVAKDYTVSGESFEIWECAHCTVRFTQNIPDSSQIGAYYRSEKYISHSDTRKGVINSLYHMVRKKTLAGKAQLLRKQTGVSNGSLLDIGAGTGAFSAYMKETGWSVSAVEPDEAARQTASSLYGLEIKEPQSLWEWQEGSFDAITMWHVLEHVHDLHAYLQQIKKLLRDQGKAFVAVPNYTSHDAQHYKSYWAAYDVPRHLYHFSPASFRVLLQKHALHLHGIQPMWFDSFYVSMLSEKYMKGKNQYASAFLTGMKSNRIARKDKERCSSLIYIIAKY